MWIRIDHIDDLNRKNIFISNLANFCFAVFLLFSQNSKTASISRYWSWCTILTKCPDTMICMWHTNVLTCSSPCAACSGHRAVLLFCCFTKTADHGAKQQPDNTPKTCEHKIWPQIHQPDGGIWLGFQGSSQLPIGTKRLCTFLAVSVQNPGGEWAQPF